MDATSDKDRRSVATSRSFSAPSLICADEKSKSNVKLKQSNKTIIKFLVYTATSKRMALDKGRWLAKPGKSGYNRRQNRTILSVLRH